MINWNNVQQQFIGLFNEAIQVINSNNLSVMNTMIVGADYLDGEMVIMIDNPQAMYNAEADEYIVVAGIEVEEWKNDCLTVPSLTEEEFHEGLTTSLKQIFSDPQIEQLINSLNPTLPFSVELSLCGFPDTELLLLGESVDEKEALKNIAIQNFQKTQSQPTDDAHQQALIQAQEQMKNMMGNMPGMDNFQMPDISAMVGQTMDQLYDNIVEDDSEWEFCYAETPHATSEQQRALALGAIMKVARGEQLNTIESGTNELEEARDGLVQAWSIECRETALATLSWLKNEGHRAIYQAVLSLMNEHAWHQMQDVIISKIPELLPVENEEEQKETIEKALSFYDSMKQASRTYLKEEVFTTQYPESIDAWDYGRLVNVACWCAECGYIDDTEAWEYIMEAHNATKNKFSSWKEYGQNYLFGRHVWNIDSMTHDPMKEIFEFLLSDTNSLWNKMPFIK